jgi:hypothetical protein
VLLLHLFVFRGSLSHNNGLLFLFALATTTLTQSRRKSLAQHSIIWINAAVIGR